MQKLVEKMALNFLRALPVPLGRTGREASD